MECMIHFPVLSSDSDSVEG